MPRLPDYDAPARELTPSDKGANAFEQAGRRIGPAYNEAATLTREGGAVAGDLIKQRRWPFDMLELSRSLSVLSEAKKGDNPTGMVGTQIQGGVNGMVNDRGGHVAADRSDGKAHRSHTGADVGGMSVAAAGLGRMAAAMAQGNQYRNSKIDQNGVDLMDPRNQPKGYTALEQGRLVRYNNDGVRLDKEPKDQFSGPNAGAERAAQGGTQWTNPTIDWSDPKNQAKREAEYQRTGVDPVSGSMSDPSGQQSSSRSFGETGVDSYGNPRLPPSGDYGGGRDPDVDDSSRYLPGNPFDPAPEIGGRENPFSQLSPSGAAEAKDAVDWMKGQYGDGAGTDAMAPSGGGSDDTTYDSGSGDY